MEETLTKCKFYSLVRYYLVILLQQHPSQIGHWLSYTVTTHPWSNLARPILLYCYITSDCHGRIDYSTSDQLHIMGGVADNSHLSSVISNISTYLSSFTVNTFHWAFFVSIFISHSLFFSLSASHKIRCKVVFFKYLQILIFIHSECIPLSFLVSICIP